MSSIEGVSRELACLVMSSLFVLSSVSYCVYELLGGMHAFLKSDLSTKEK